jgi:hypothetical protein
LLCVFLISDLSKSPVEEKVDNRELQLSILHPSSPLTESEERTVLSGLELQLEIKLKNLSANDT